MSEPRHPVRRETVGLLICCWIAAAILGSAAGCGNGYPKCAIVHGRVTYRGKPVGTGVVSFVRVDQAKTGGLVRPATGDLQADGSYEMKTFRDGDGVLPGEYAVSIVSFDYSGKRNDLQRLPSLIPSKYGLPETSGLKAAVPADASGALQMDFELKD
jgi:hypothetical protein